MTGQPVERALHNRPHVSVDFIDVGIFAERAVTSIGSSTSVTILAGSGKFGGKIALRPNGNPKLNGKIFIRSLVRPSLRASQLPRVKNSCVSWPPIDTIGTIGTPASMAVSDVAGAAVEVDRVGAERGPVGVVVAAREHQDQCVRMQGGRGVFARSPQ